MAFTVSQQPAANNHLHSERPIWIKLSSTNAATDHVQLTIKYSTDHGGAYTDLITTKSYDANGDDIFDFQVQEFINTLLSPMLRALEATTVIEVTGAYVLIDHSATEAVETGTLAISTAGGDGAVALAASSFNAYYVHLSANIWDSAATTLNLQNLGFTASTGYATQFLSRFTSWKMLSTLQAHREYILKDTPGTVDGLRFPEQQDTYLTVHGYNSEGTWLGYFFEDLDATAVNRRISIPVGLPYIASVNSALTNANSWSYYLVSQLISQPKFTSAGSWTVTGSFAISGDLAVTGAGTAYHSISVTAGDIVTISVNCNVYSAGTVYYGILANTGAALTAMSADGTGGLGAITTSGTSHARWTALTTATYYVCLGTNGVSPSLNINLSSASKNSSLLGTFTLTTPCDYKVIKFLNEFGAYEEIIAVNPTIIRETSTDYAYKVNAFPSDSDWNTSGLSVANHNTYRRVQTIRNEFIEEYTMRFFFRETDGADRISAWLNSSDWFFVEPNNSASTFDYTFVQPLNGSNQTLRIKGGIEVAVRYRLANAKTSQRL